MTTTASTNTNFSFRSKFKRLLNEENLPYFVSAFEKFCAYDKESALNCLWRLTYSKEIAIEEIRKLGVHPQYVPDENIHTFRNELRVQYEKFDTTFLDIDTPEEYKKEFEELVNQSDIIVANVIFFRCIDALNGAQTDRILRLLKDEKDNNYFGGIRSLCFCKEAAEYLKPFHMQIHNLLEKLRIYFSDYRVEIPFIDEDEYLAVIDEESSNQTDFEEKVEEEHPKQICDKSELMFKALTPAEILAHQEVFKPFVEEEDMNILLLIGKIGFDLNEVMAKQEKIRNLIWAIEDFG